MPKSVEMCVSKVKQKWAADPSSMPKKMKDGKPVKTDDDKTSLAFAICQAAHKAEVAIATKMLEGVGPVILGVAATNRPHLPLPPLSIVEKDGKKYIRTPMVVQGIFKHPDGDLVFNEETMQRMLQNHEAGVSHYGVSMDIRHKPEMGSLAWYTKKRGGWIQEEEDPEFGKLLVGYGPPTTSEAEKAVESGQYLYASIEFHPNYESNVVPMSWDNVREITLEELLQEEAITMTYPIKNADGTVVLSAEQFVEYEASKTKVVTLEAQVKTLAAAKPKTTEEELPEGVRKMLEARDREVASLKRRMLESDVTATIARAGARRDETGRAHAPVLLEWAEKLMKGQPVGTDGVIKLENGNEAHYVNQAVTWLLDHLPGQVPTTEKTAGDDTRLEDAQLSKEDYKGFWGKEG